VLHGLGSRHEEGTFMAYVRFTPQEYRTIYTLCRLTNFHEYPAPAFRRLLVRCLDTWPQLATQVRQLRKSQLTVLYDHLRSAAQTQEEPVLSAEEVEFLKAISGPLLTNTRFIGPLKAALIQHLRGSYPTLAGKLAALSTAEFQAACERPRGHRA
jgi:hypothetical protein